MVSSYALCEYHQEEVVDLARQEMMESSGYVSRLLEGPDSSGSGGRPAISGDKSSEDVQVQRHGWVECLSQLEAGALLGGQS